MNRFIGLELQTFASNIDALKTATNNISSGKQDGIELSGKSEVMSDYMECLSEIETLMSAYRVFLNQDIQRIESAGYALIQAEKELLE